MDFGLLGPLEVRVDGRLVPLAGRKQRALLARLLLDANRTVSTVTLVDDLWGEEAPETAQKMVQIHVSNLRKVLPQEVLQTRPPGYALEVDPGAIDLARFERLREEGQAALAAGDAELASARLREALELWRGPALAEFREPFAQAEANRLEELHLACLEARIDADLRLGRQAELVAELDTLVARHPLREALVAHRMLALYRSGRQPEALGAYSAFRSRLAAELGLEPSARLRELERRILRQDRELEAADASAAPLPTLPDVRYVRSGSVSIAYEVVGDGPVDLVLVHAWVFTFQPGWEWPRLASFYRRLATIGRLIMFDKRGTGMSDRVAGSAPLEERMDDVRAVMDAVGSERAVLLGAYEGGPMATLFAATYPERTAGIVLMGTFARRFCAADYPLGGREQDVWLAHATADNWGLPMARRFIDERAPSLRGNEDAYRWYASYIVRGASPGAAVQLGRMNAEIDVRHVLPTVHVPALVLYREREYIRHLTRYMGERIPGARVVELPGADHLPWEGDQESLLREIEAFVAGLDTEPEPDRVLTTVLVVEADGTKEGCDVVRHEVSRYRGRELELTEDTLVATFDGPARAIRCAMSLFVTRGACGRARAGLHTGECEVVRGAPAGLPVELARALKDLAEPGEIVISSTVRDLVAGSGLEFEARRQEPAGLDAFGGDWRLYSLARPVTAGA